MLEIKIKQNNYAYLYCDDQSLLKLIKKSFTRKIKKYNNYYRIYEDKINKYYNVVNNNSIYFKAGLTQFLINSLQDRNVEYNLIDLRQKTKVLDDSIVVQLNSEVKLRDYQEEAVKSVFKQCYCSVQLPTASGKTEVSASIIKTFQQNTSNKTVLYVVPTITLQNEARDRFTGYNIVCNTKLPIQKGIVNILTYATMLRSKIDYKQKDLVNALIFDECHHLRAEKSSKIVHNYKRLQLCVGLSATVSSDIQYKTKLNKLIDSDFNIFGCTGYPAYYKLILTTLKEKVITPIEVCVRTNPNYIVLDENEKSDWHKIREKFLMSDERLEFIADYVYDIMSDSNMNTLCLLIPEVRWSQIQMKRVALKLKDKGIRFILTYGQERYDELVDGELFHIVEQEAINEVKSVIRDPKTKTVFSATSYMYEGINITNIQALVNVYGGRSNTRIKQQIGRIVRLFEGKEIAYVYEVFDKNKVLTSQLKERLSIYQREYHAKILKN